MRLRTICGAMRQDVFAARDYDAAARRRENAGGAGAASVRAHSERLRKWLQSGNLAG